MLEDISSICYKFDVIGRKYLREPLLHTLKEYFTSYEYQCIEEYEIPYISTKTQIIGRSKKKQQIDLVARREKMLIFAIEFDSGTTLKYETIKKLFQSGAGILIGITSGNLKIPFNVLKQKNVDKLKIMLEDYRRMKGKTPHYKAFYLICLSHKTCIRVFMNMELLSNHSHHV